MIWFSPLCSKNVKTNIGKKFLNLIKKHFPPHHKFRKLFNKNTVKINYSCTWNITTIKGLFPKKTTEQRTYNCLNKVNCPLEQKCFTTNIVYKVTSSHQNYQEKVYFGVPYNSESTCCLLCLNKKNEIVSKWRHQLK